MMTFGKSLREAREAKGLTIAQLADTTHMTPNTITELENEDFSHIAAPIYGRGFVKLYCSAVGLEPKPFLDEFMEILNGSRDTLIRERPVSAETADVEPIADAPLASEPDAADALPAEEMSEPDETATAEDSSPDEEPSPAEPSPIAAEPEVLTRPPIISQQDFFREEPIPPPPPVRTVFPPSQTAQMASMAQPTPTTHEPTLSRYAPPAQRALSGSIPSPAYWRIGALAAAALLVLALICLGIRALYRATAAGPEPSEPATASEAATAAETTTSAEKAMPAVATAAAKKSEAKTPPKTQPASTRTPQKIPSLYVD